MTCLRRAEAALAWCRESGQGLLELRDDLGVRDLVSDSVIGWITDTRNYLTHYSSHLEGKAASGGDLYWLSEVLRYFAQACILKEVGLDDAQVRELLDRNGQFQLARSRVEEALGAVKAGDVRAPGADG